MKPALGAQEAQLLALLQMRKQRTVRTGELLQPLGLEPSQEGEILRRLARGGLIARVRRGLYLVPETLPLGGAWSPDAGLALKTLLDDRAGSYQICGPNAFNRYGWDGQVPARIYAYNDRISGERTVGKLRLVLVKVGVERLGDTEAIPQRDGGTAIYSSRVRSLVDAVYDWSRFNSLPRGYSWIESELTSRRIKAAELVGCALRYGDTATKRRIGALLQRLDVPRSTLRGLVSEIGPTSSPIPWDPSRPKRGVADRRWGVVMNADA